MNFLFFFTPATIPELVSTGIGLLGVGAGLGSFLWKSKISQTIIEQLDKRYQQQSACMWVHGALTSRFDGIEEGQARAQDRLDRVFEVLSEIRRNGHS
jgi:hypothetical protein